jgi:hypothetical protein
MNPAAKSRVISVLIASFLSRANCRSFCLIGLAVFEMFKECSIRLQGTPGMSVGFYAKTRTLSLRNLTSLSSYLAFKLAPMRAVFYGSPSTSWTSLCSLDLMFLLGVCCLGSLS